MAAAEGVSIQGREELRMLQRRPEQSSAPASLPRTKQEQTESRLGRTCPGAEPFSLEDLDSKGLQWSVSWHVGFQFSGMMSNVNRGQKDLIRTALVPGCHGSRFPNP